jgi:hypothetical protein
LPVGFLPVGAHHRGLGVGGELGGCGIVAADASLESDEALLNEALNVGVELERPLGPELPPEDEQERTVF